MELSRRMINENLNWFHRGGYSNIWERARLHLNKKIHLSCLVWLANSSALSEITNEELTQIMTQINSLDDEQLVTWDKYCLAAPWGHILNLAFASKPESHIVWCTKAITRMAQHPQLIEAMVKELNQITFEKFASELFRADLPTTKLRVRRRLRSIAFVLADSKWERAGSSEGLYLQALTSISITLQVLHQDEGGPINGTKALSQRIQEMTSIWELIPYKGSEKFHVDSIRQASTSWIFTLCKPDSRYSIDYVDDIEAAQENVGNASPLNAIADYLLGKLPFRRPTWPDPSHISFIKDPFDNEHLRNTAILRYVEYIDACLSHRATLRSYPETEWRWGYFHIPEENISRAHLLQILAEYILPIATRADDSPRNTRRILDRLMKRPYSCSALHEVIIYYHSGYRNESARCRLDEESRQEVIDVLPNGTDGHTWDEAWLYVLELRLGIHDERVFRGTSPLIEHDRKELLVVLLVSEFTHDRLHSFRENILSKVAESIPAETWVKVVGKLGIIGASRYGRWMSKLPTNVYLEVFSHFLFDDNSDIRTALLEALLEDIQSAEHPIMEGHNAPIFSVFRAIAEMARALVPNPRRSLTQLFDGILNTIHLRRERNLLISSLVVAWYIAGRRTELKDHESDYIRLRLFQIVQAVGVIEPNTRPYHGDEIQASQSTIEAYLATLGYDISSKIMRPIRKGSETSIKE
ncbi:hypothetical protein CPB86DRAFT_635799 [Serendipita vermifera]|nr:hypothetical protein CPB86DRAFT_635799 [Serendipita vermifera]